MALKRLFYRPHYTSDTTDFLHELYDKDPELLQRQKEGRHLLWDRDLDREQLKGYAKGRVHQQAYVYYQHDV